MVAARRLIRRLSPWIGGLSALFVMGSVCWHARYTSPGEISFVHAREAILTQSGNCSACHGSVVKSMTTACVDCHEDIQTERVEKTGFHGTMPTGLALDCAKCHAEHQGKEFPLVSYRSFSLAGVLDPGSFDHSGLDFHLQGKHLNLLCKDCHEFAEIDIVPKGAKRFRGLEQRCTSCHDDVHEGGYGPDCASCHGQEQPFSRVAEFAHTAAFELLGAHRKAACVDCHKKSSIYSVDALLARRPQGGQPLLVRDCATCHFSPHYEPFLIAISTHVNLEPQGSCEYCHSAVHETFDGSKASFDAELHAVTGFPLDIPHDNVACEGCHNGFGRSKPEVVDFLCAYPGRSADDCRACHGDPHRGQFKDGPFQGSDCLTCHERERFRPTTFTLDQHAETRFPLNGAHRTLDCSECHKVPDENPNEAEESVVTTIYRETPTVCRECHGDPHQGQFEQGTFAGGDCRSCHNEDSFRHSTLTLEQHTQTRFPLTGAHRAVSCNACHTAPAQLSDIRRDDGAGEVRIVPRVFCGTSTECNDCHADFHGGAFDQPACPIVVDGKKGCARCHSTERFDKLRDVTFDHGKWTGYELRGAHAAVLCRACHERSSSPNSVERTFGRARGRSCQDCHGDPHVGQFGPTPQVNCSRCHLESDSFRDLVFDHQTDSRFPLDNDHVELACSVCHRPHAVSGEKAAIRYKPLGFSCGDCHVPRGPKRQGT
jgi:hypothetical protein